MKQAILFPGIGYHSDKPLLYYSKKILKNEGYEIIEVQFSNLDFDLNKSKDKAYKQAKSQLENIALKDVLLISKSIGTYCAARIAKENGLSKNIYFTTLESTLKYLEPNDLVYSGTLDQWANYSIIKKHFPNVHTITNGNHSLETGNVLENIDNLKKIMNTVEQYIRTRN